MPALTARSDEITRVLHDWKDGKPDAAERLFPLVYGELHKLASQCFRGERRGHTLQTTALVHEAFLKLSGGREMDWADRRHFFATAARAMRQILVDHARNKRRLKRGGNNIRLSLEDAMLVSAEQNGVDIIALNEVLERLAKRDPQQAAVVDLRFFGGLSLDETAATLAISRATAAREWEAARAWLYRELTK